jgi:hypothetical protein
MREGKEGLAMDEFLEKRAEEEGGFKFPNAESKVAMCRQALPLSATSLLAPKGSPTIRASFGKFHRIIYSILLCSNLAIESDDHSVLSPLF